MAAQRVSMAEVAREAGVSVASVSYALNDQPGVGPELRARILEVAARLGFRPDRLARGLRQGRLHVVGLLVPDIANPFYPEIANGVIERARDDGYDVVVAQRSPEAPGSRDAVQTLLDLRVDGLVFTDLVTNDKELLRDLGREQVPVVQAVRAVKGVAADFVGIDDLAGGREIAAHLLGLGHRRIAVLSGPLNSSASHNRLRGYRQAFADAKVELPSELLRECELTYESGYDRLTQLAGEGASFSAVLAGNDVIAVGVIDALYDLGRSVPDEVSVAGYDDIAWARSKMFGLTTVRQPRAELGREAMRLLAERIERPGARPRRVLLGHELIVRETTVRPVGHGRRVGTHATHARAGERPVATTRRSLDHTR